MIFHNVCLKTINIFSIVVFPSPTNNLLDNLRQTHNRRMEPCQIHLSQFIKGNRLFLRFPNYVRHIHNKDLRMRFIKNWTT